MPAAGVLYNVYRVYRDRLGTVGLIALRPKRKNAVSVESAQTASTLSIQDSNTEEVHSIDFLKSHTDPKPEMVHHWNKSRAERDILVAQMSNTDYFKLFPVLQMGNGFEFVLMDFNHKHPNTPDIMTIWPSFSEKILAYAKTRKNKSEHLKLLLKDADAIENPTLMALKILPHVLRTTNKKQTKPKSTKSSTTAKSTTRSSKSEVTVNSNATSSTTAKSTIRSSRSEVAVDLVQYFTVFFFFYLNQVR